MLTIFTLPKPFEGDAARLQRNAIRSWRALGPEIEILLFGDEPGIAEAAGEFGARHVPAVARTDLGTPLVGDAFRQASGIARHPHICYANADIVLLSDLPAALRRLGGRRVLLVGRRLNVEYAGELDTAPSDWETRFRKEVVTGGWLGNEYAIDWFVFPRDVDWRMPPFAVGRPVWDNWTLWRARDLGLPLVDATEIVTVVHQMHGYGHVPQSTGLAWEGPEAERNRELIGTMRRRFNLLDATHLLTPAGMRPARRPRHLKRRLVRFSLDHRWAGVGLGLAIRARRRLLDAVGRPWSSR